MADGADTPQPIFGGVTYNQALQIDHDYGVNGIDAALSQFHLDAVMTATDNPAWPTDLLFGDRFFFGTSNYAAPEGYPIVQVPAAYVDGLPMGISFFGTAFSEPKLITLASGFEAVTQARAHNLPAFPLMAPSNNIQGTTPTKVTRRAYPAMPQPKTKAAPHHL
jgi:amidase